MWPVQTQVLRRNEMRQRDWFVLSARPGEVRLRARGVRYPVTPHGYAWVRNPRLTTWIQLKEHEKSLFSGLLQILHRTLVPKKENSGCLMFWVQIALRNVTSRNEYLSYLFWTCVRAKTSLVQSKEHDQHVSNWSLLCRILVVVLMSIIFTFLAIKM